MAQRSKQDINVYQGDDRAYSFQFYTDTSQTLKWNISAATAVKLSAKQTLDAEAVLFEVTATNGAGGNDWANGLVVFEIPKASSALFITNGKYDVQITISGRVITPVYGDVIVQRQVTPST